MRNTTGITATATGFQALMTNTTGDSNTAIGVSTRFLSNTTGIEQHRPLALRALDNNTTGSNNIALGVECRRCNVTTAENVICIGAERVWCERERPVALSATFLAKRLLPARRFTLIQTTGWER